MKHFMLLFVLLHTLALNCFAQPEVGRYDYWQPGVTLSFDMFTGDLPDSVETQNLLSRNIGHTIATGMWGVLDVPATKKGWKTMVEKAYFCAALDKKMSFWLVKDSTELKYAQLLWDVCEVAARMSRRNLEQLQQQAGGNGMISIMYVTSLNDGKEFGRDVSNSIMQRVIIPRNEEEYKSFREMVDQYLLELSQYATTQADIQRFVTDKPDEGYKMADKLHGDIKNRGKIRY